MSKIERIKAETDGLDVLPELLRAAREGWETLEPEHVGLLKWYGLYAHNTADGHFMMRVKVIQGKLSAAQAETMASIAEDFGRGSSTARRASASRSTGSGWRTSRRSSSAWNASA